MKKSRYRAFPPPQVGGLCLDYPIRPQFVAQVVIPMDMTINEARRLEKFILSLAQPEE